MPWWTDASQFKKHFNNGPGSGTKKFLKNGSVYPTRSLWSVFDLLFGAPAPLKIDRLRSYWVNSNVQYSYLFRFGRAWWLELSGIRKRSCFRIKHCATSSNISHSSPPSLTTSSLRSTFSTKFKSIATTTWTSWRLSTKSSSFCTRVSCFYFKN